MPIEEAAVEERHPGNCQYQRAELPARLFDGYGAQPGLFCRGGLTLKLSRV